MTVARHDRYREVVTQDSSDSEAHPHPPTGGVGNPPAPRTRRVERWVFWPAAVVVLAFSGFAILAPAAAEAMFTTIQATIVNAFNWYYVLIAAFFVAFALVMGFSRFGDIKLGRDDDKPEFSVGAWFSLLFAAGMGIGLVFYGVSEPLRHYVDPRPGVSGTPPQLAQQVSCRRTCTGACRPGPSTSWWASGWPVPSIAVAGRSRCAGRLSRCSAASGSRASRGKHNRASERGWIAPAPTRRDRRRASGGVSTRE